MLEYPLTRPVIPFAVVVLYVTGVLIALAFAPSSRKNAESKAPQQQSALLKWFTAFHNALMCGLSAWMCYEAFAAASETFGWFSPGVPFKLWCQPMEPQGRPYSPASARMARVTWVFVMSKYPELIDTVIMLVKGNYRQVSFLHVFHHAVMIFPIGEINAIYYAVVREWQQSGDWAALLRLSRSVYGLQGDGYFPVLLNSGVHVIMYGHYFVTGLGTSVG